MKLDKANSDNARAYLACQPKPLGTLHERMKYVIEILVRDNIINKDLWRAVYELQTEVSLSTSVDPPFCKRTIE